MNILFEKISGLTFLLIAIYVVISMGIFLETLLKVYKNQFDELEKKSIVDSLALSLVVVFIFFIVQSLVANQYQSRFGSNFPSVVSSGLKFDSNPIHIESFIFLLVIFTILYNLTKHKYGLSSSSWRNLSLISALGLATLLLTLTLHSFNIGIANPATSPITKTGWEGLDIGKLLLGVCFIGYFIVKFIKDKNKLYLISSFIIYISLIYGGSLVHLYRFLPSEVQSILNILNIGLFLFLITLMAKAFKINKL